MAAAAALVFGSVACHALLTRSRLIQAEAQIQAARLRQLEQQALAHQTELRLLQAQIEPHFLFNTLSNVVSLVDVDPPRARRMLLDLTALLRVSLARSRAPEVSLGEELDLLAAYLDIMALRLGPRLGWEIDAAPALRALRLPPLLVQPLVENALRHGLEPLPEGGRVLIRCWQAEGRLWIRVEDNGQGLAAAALGGAGGGLGLANVRARLDACFAGEGLLRLGTCDPQGTWALLELPCVS